MRDLKAAVRFVRAHAAAYGIDAARVVVSGGSAGATNSVAAGATFDSDYVDELSVDQDPTLASTHLDQNSSVQCVVSHWASDGEIMLAQAHDAQNRTRFGPNNAPIIEFHGDQDTTIPITPPLVAWAPSVAAMPAVLLRSAARAPGKRAAQAASSTRG